MQVWERSRCTSAWRFIIVLSFIVFPQVWHWYFSGPPSSTRAIIDSSNAFKSIMRFISYRLWGLRGHFWGYCVCNRPRIITKKASWIWFSKQLYFSGTMHLSRGTQHHWHDIWYIGLREHSLSWSSLRRQCKSGWHQGALLRVSSLCTCRSPSRRPCTSTCLGYLFQPLTPV